MRWVVDGEHSRKEPTSPRNPPSVLDKKIATNLRAAMTDEGVDLGPMGEGFRRT